VLGILPAGVRLGKDGEMRTKEAAPAEVSTAPRAQGRRLFDVLILVAFGLLLLGLAWPFLADTTRLAVTKDPAWYTWRGKLLLEANPALLLTKHGPFGMLSGGYRITTPVLGALLNRIAGVAPQRYTILMMVGMPLLACAALGTFAYRCKARPFLYLITLVAGVGLFLTTPYLGYLDDVTCLFLLATALPFLAPARTSWGARSAVALILFLAVLTHPTTTGIFALVLVASTVLRWLAFRFSLRRTLEMDGPMLLSALAGVVVGAAYWRLGLWGAKAGFGESVLSQPYTSAFFRARLNSWLQSMHPKVTYALVALAVAWIAATWWRARPKPVDWHSRMSLLWALPLIGIFGYVLGKSYPYYRFINPTLSPMLLVGLGLWVIVWGMRWLARRQGWNVRAMVAVGMIGALAIAGFLYLKPGFHAWSRQTPWIDDPTLVAATAARAYADAQPDRPVVFIISPDPASATAWGAAKQAMNTTLAALSGNEIARTFFFVGTPQDFVAGRPTLTGNALYDRISRGFLGDAQAGLQAFGQEPMVLRLDVDNKAAPAPDAGLLRELGSGVSVVVVSGTAPFSQAAADVATRTANAQARKLRDHPSPFANPGHLLRNIVGLFLMLVLPGLIASRWFGLSDLPTKLGLIPGLSIGLLLGAGVLVIAVHHGPIEPLQGWLTLALALLAAVGLAALAHRRPHLIEQPVDDVVPVDDDPTAAAFG
jgi:hypothetical protein